MTLLTFAKVFLALAVAWSAAALAVQVYVAWGGGRRDYSVRKGSPVRGIVYNFTVAMTPAHKESVSRHPVAFVVGLVMHVGVVLALIGVVLLAVWPAAGVKVLGLGGPVVVLSLLAGVSLLIRRLFARNLRVMNVPDDYIAILASCGLLALASIPIVVVGHSSALMIYTGFLLVYLPLGKLRHAVFFFVARGDYGRRLGFRGVYPPAATPTE